MREPGGTAAGLLIKPLEEVGDFWRARLDTALDATYDAQAGYSGTLTGGKTTAVGLTLEFGDVVYDFTCPACGEFRVHGKRVVLVKAYCARRPDRAMDLVRPPIVGLDRSGTSRRRRPAELARGRVHAREE